MADEISRFETIARRTPQYTEQQANAEWGHPFEVRGIHPSISDVARRLFDDGHYAQATFEALKLIENEVQEMSGLLSKNGVDLMMAAFKENSPKIRLTEQSNQSEASEQQGFKFLFAGAMLAIRNPRGHGVGVVESPDECLEHLSLASLLLRRLDAVGRVA